MCVLFLRKLFASIMKKHGRCKLRTFRASAARISTSQDSIAFAKFSLAVDLGIINGGDLGAPLKRLHATDAVRCFFCSINGYVVDRK